MWFGFSRILKRGDIETEHRQMNSLNSQKVCNQFISNQFISNQFISIPSTLGNEKLPIRSLMEPKKFTTIVPDVVQLKKVKANSKLWLYIDAINNNFVIDFVLIIKI